MEQTAAELERARLQRLANGYARKVAETWIARADNLQMKGKGRDGAALEFFCGAQAMASQVNVDISPLTFLVSVRGHAAVVSYLAEPANG